MRRRVDRPRREGRMSLAADPALIQALDVAGKRWGELDPRGRQAILLGAAFEAGLKTAALIDLARRPARDVRGSKAGWAAAIVLVNSLGLVPVAYFLRGRRR